MSRLFITACRRNMSTKKLSTKLCRQNEFDQICCRPINFRRSVWRQNVRRQSFVDKVSFDKTYCRQMICNSLKRPKMQGDQTISGQFNESYFIVIQPII